MKLYTFPPSPNARKVAAVIAHLQLTDIEHALIRLQNGEHRQPDYLAINPMGKVPAIKHCDTVVTEAGAICAYLADAFPDAGLAPPSGNSRRGRYYRWMFFAAGPVEAAVTGKSLGLLAPPDKKMMAGYGSFEETIDTLERCIGSGPYICGDQFTAADVYVGSQIMFPMQFNMLPEKDSFVRYRDRLTARKAYQRANRLDDEAQAQVQAAQRQPA